MVQVLEGSLGAPWETTPTPCSSPPCKPGGLSFPQPQAKSLPYPLWNSYTIRPLSHPAVCVMAQGKMSVHAQGHMLLFTHTQYVRSSPAPV